MSPNVEILPHLLRGCSNFTFDIWHFQGVKELKSRSVPNKKQLEEGLKKHFPTSADCWSSEVTVIKSPPQSWLDFGSVSETGVDIDIPSRKPIMKEKSHTNATNATMPHLKKATWGHIWKRTVEKSQTNVTSVTMHALIQVHWGRIWKRTVEKGQTSATNVTMPLLGQVI